MTQSYFGWKVCEECGSQYVGYGGPKSKCEDCRKRFNRKEIEKRQEEKSWANDPGNSNY